MDGGGLASGLAWLMAVQTRRRIGVTIRWEVFRGSNRYPLRRDPCMRKSESSMVGGATKARTVVIRAINDKKRVTNADRHRHIPTRPDKGMATRDKGATSGTTDHLGELSRVQAEGKVAAEGKQLSKGVSSTACMSTAVKRRFASVQT